MNVGKNESNRCLEYIISLFSEIKSYLLNPFIKTDHHMSNLIISIYVKSKLANV